MIEHDPRSISVPKAAAAGPWPCNGVRGGRRGRLYRADARQRHLVVSVCNVLPDLQSQRRIAPDLIGTGDSDKLPDSGLGSYRFIERPRCLDAVMRVTTAINRFGVWQNPRK